MWPKLGALTCLFPAFVGYPICQTYYGHQNSCNSVTFNVLGTTLASTDADGMVKLWDTRMTAEICTINTGGEGRKLGMGQGLGMRRGE